MEAVSWRVSFLKPSVNEASWNLNHLSEQFILIKKNNKKHNKKK